LKPEWWSLPLLQEEKYQEKPVKREEEIIIMMKRCAFWSTLTFQQCSSCHIT
jgi:hypothetical protein